MRRGSTCGVGVAAVPGLFVPPAALGGLGGPGRNRDGESWPAAATSTWPVTQTGVWSLARRVAVVAVARLLAGEVVGALAPPRLNEPGSAPAASIPWIAQAVDWVLSAP